MNYEDFDRLARHSLTSMTITEGIPSIESLIAHIDIFIHIKTDLNILSKVIDHLCGLEYIYATKFGKIEYESYKQHIIERTNRVLLGKRKEYSGNGDRLLNFKDSYRPCNRYTTKEYCFAYMMKHLVCIYDAEISGQAITQDWIDEKFGDALNYCLLLKGLVVEQRKAIV
jgi:hypothetical protein